MSLERLAVLAKKRIDALTLFRAMPSQVRVFKSRATELLVRGGNRSSKSTQCAIAIAAIALDKPIYGVEGDVIEMRRPHQKGRALLIWTIGIQVSHADTIHRLLCRPGLFKIIRDKSTGAWRAWNPLYLDDAEREDECKPSPPLIPPSEIEEIGWTSKKDKQWQTIQLRNGTTIKFYPSTGNVKAGDPVDEIWIDEEIDNPAYFAEWRMRLLDMKGRLRWSSWPSVTNYALLDFSERAQKQAEEVKKGLREYADCEEYIFTLEDNPYISAEEKRKARESMSDDEWRARNLGEYVLDRVKIYPQFNHKVHCAWGDEPELDDLLAKVLRASDGVPPDDWTRELILDPGTARPAVLFGAIPPQQFWINRETPYFVVYDEIYLRQKTAEDIAKIVQERSRNIRFERFIIDGQAARQTPMGFASTIGANYSRAFRDRNLRCWQTMEHFTPGDPNFTTRSQVVERWLQIRDNGRAQLRIVTSRCPGLVRQMSSNVKTLQKEEVKERPAPGQEQDCRVALEYWASRNPKYVLPHPKQTPIDDNIDRFEAWIESMTNGGSQRGYASLGMSFGGAA